MRWQTSGDRARSMPMRLFKIWCPIQPWMLPKMTMTTIRSRPVSIVIKFQPPRAIKFPSLLMQSTLLFYQMRISSRPEINRPGKVSFLPRLHLYFLILRNTEIMTSTSHILLSCTLLLVHQRHKSTKEQTVVQKSHASGLLQPQPNPNTYS